MGERASIAFSPLIRRSEPAGGRSEALPVRPHSSIRCRTPAVEHIVIETSGLALPKPLVQAFHWPAIKSRVTVDGVVAVVDGAALAQGRVAAMV